MSNLKSETHEGLMLNTAKIHPRIMEIPLYVKTKDKPYLESEKKMNFKDQQLLSQLQGNRKQRSQHSHEKREEISSLSAAKKAQAEARDAKNWTVAPSILQTPGKHPLSCSPHKPQCSPCKSESNLKGEENWREACKKSVVNLTESSPLRVPKQFLAQNQADLDEEIENLKNMKQRLDQQTKAWKKMPQVFQYALDLHSKEQLDFQKQIIDLKKENNELKLNLKLQQQDEQLVHKKALAVKKQNKVLAETVDKLKYEQDKILERIVISSLSPSDRLKLGIFNTNQSRGSSAAKRKRPQSSAQERAFATHGSLPPKQKENLSTSFQQDRGDRDLITQDPSQTIQQLGDYGGANILSEEQKLLYLNSFDQRSNFPGQGAIPIFSNHTNASETLSKDVSAPNFKTTGPMETKNYTRGSIESLVVFQNQSGEPKKRLPPKRGKSSKQANTRKQPELGTMKLTANTQIVSQTNLRQASSKHLATLRSMQTSLQPKPQQPVKKLRSNKSNISQLVSAQVPLASQLSTAEVRNLSQNQWSAQKNHTYANPLTQVGGVDGKPFASSTIRPVSGVVGRTKFEYMKNSQPFLGSLQSLPSDIHTRAGMENSGGYSRTNISGDQGQYQSNSDIRQTLQGGVMISDIQTTNRAPGGSKFSHTEAETLKAMGPMKHALNTEIGDTSSMRRVISKSSKGKQHLRHHPTYTTTLKPQEPTSKDPLKSNGRSITVVPNIKSQAFDVMHQAYPSKDGTVGSGVEAQINISGGTSPIIDVYSINLPADQREEVRPAGAQSMNQKQRHLLQTRHSRASFASKTSAAARVKSGKKKKFNKNRTGGISGFEFIERPHVEFQSPWGQPSHLTGAGHTDRFHKQQSQKQIAGQPDLHQDLRQKSYLKEPSHAMLSYTNALAQGDNKSMAFSKERPSIPEFQTSMIKTSSNLGHLREFGAPTSSRSMRASHSTEFENELQQKELIIEELKNQLTSLEHANAELMYRNTLGEDEVEFQPNFEKHQDLQDLFFECVYSACKQHHRSQGIEQRLETRGMSRQHKKDLKKMSTSEKAESLMKFVTNRHVLNILYDIMFRFQRVKERALRKGNPVNRQFHQEIMKEVYAAVREPVLESPLLMTQPNDFSPSPNKKLTRQEAKKLALYKLTQRQAQLSRSSNIATSVGLNLKFQQIPQPPLSQSLAGDATSFLDSKQEVPHNQTVQIKKLIRPHPGKSSDHVRNLHIKMKTGESASKSMHAWHKTSMVNQASKFQISNPSIHSATSSLEVKGIGHQSASQAFLAGAKDTQSTKDAGDKSTTRGHPPVQLNSGMNTLQNSVNRSKYDRGSVSRSKRVEAFVQNRQLVIMKDFPQQATEPDIQVASHQDGSDNNADTTVPLLPYRLEDSNEIDVPNESGPNDGTFDSQKIPIIDQVLGDSNEFTRPNPKLLDQPQKIEVAINGMNIQESVNLIKNSDLFQSGGALGSLDKGAVAVVSVEGSYPGQLSKKGETDMVVIGGSADSENKPIQASQLQGPRTKSNMLSSGLSGGAMQFNTDGLETVGDPQIMKMSLESQGKQFQATLVDLQQPGGVLKAKVMTADDRDRMNEVSRTTTNQHLIFRENTQVVSNSNNLLINEFPHHGTIDQGAKKKEGRNEESLTKKVLNSAVERVSSNHIEDPNFDLDQHLLKSDTDTFQVKTATFHQSQGINGTQIGGSQPHLKEDAYAVLPQQSEKSSGGRKNRRSIQLSNQSRSGAYPNNNSKPTTPLKLCRENQRDKQRSQIDQLNSELIQVENKGKPMSQEEHQSEENIETPSDAHHRIIEPMASMDQSHPGSSVKTGFEDGAQISTKRQRKASISAQEEPQIFGGEKPIKQEESPEGHTNNSPSKKMGEGSKGPLNSDPSYAGFNIKEIYEFEKVNQALNQAQFSLMGGQGQFQPVNNFMFFPVNNTNFNNIYTQPQGPSQQQQPSQTKSRMPTGQTVDQHSFSRSQQPYQTQFSNSQGRFHQPSSSSSTIPVAQPGFIPPMANQGGHMVFNQADGKMYFVQPISDSPGKQQEFYTQMTHPKSGSKRPKTAYYSQSFQQNKNPQPRFVVSGVSPNQRMVEQPEVALSSQQQRTAGSQQRRKRMFSSKASTSVNSRPDKFSMLQNLKEAHKKVHKKW